VIFPQPHPVVFSADREISFVHVPSHRGLREWRGDCNTGCGGRSLDGPREITWREPELELAVRRYLAEHPEAMDTTEGIAEWWLMRERMRVDLEALARILGRLTDEGVLERIGAGDEARYRLKGND
jgi:hypothetical protein